MKRKIIGPSKNSIDTGITTVGKRVEENSAHSFTEGSDIQSEESIIVAGQSNAPGKGAPSYKEWDNETEESRKEYKERAEKFFKELEDEGKEFFAGQTTSLSHNEVFGDRPFPRDARLKRFVKWLRGLF